MGYDLHRLIEGRPLMLGGIHIPFDRGPLGHSDGDVIAHAMCDALLGAAGLPDIGTMFPPGDPNYAGVAGTVLLRDVRQKLADQGWRVVNIDATVIIEGPAIAPFRTAMAGAIAAALDIAPEAVSVKAKTNEGMDAIGRGEAVAAHAIALIEQD